MILKIRRFDPSQGEARYQHYDVKTRPGMTVLGALFYIQDRIDDSLSFRYSCRGAVCGTCAVLVNRVPRLACRTQVKALADGNAFPREPLNPKTPEFFTEPWNPRAEVLIEPLPHFHVLKDLVVDFRRFFYFYQKTDPAFHAPPGLPERELRLDPAAVKELEVYTNCVQCGTCVAACPVVGKNSEYWGPAALAKLYRFAIDPREDRQEARLARANERDGWWSCEFFNNCKLVCPKGVPPNHAIGRARHKLTLAGKRPEGIAPDKEQAAPQPQIPVVEPETAAESEAIPMPAPEPEHPLVSAQPEASQPETVLEPAHRPEPEPEQAESAVPKQTATPELEPHSAPSRDEARQPAEPDLWQRESELEPEPPEPQVEPAEPFEPSPEPVAEVEEVATAPEPMPEPKPEEPAPQEQEEPSDLDSEPNPNFEPPAANQTPTPDDKPDAPTQDESVG